MKVPTVLTDVEGPIMTEEVISDCNLNSAGMSDVDSEAETEGSLPELVDVTDSSDDSESSVTESEMSDGYDSESSFDNDDDSSSGIPVLQDVSDSDDDHDDVESTVTDPIRMGEDSGHICSHQNCHCLQEEVRCLHDGCHR